MEIQRRVLDEGLEVTLYAHRVALRGASVPAWTLVTSGLAMLRQREVTLTILREGAAAKFFPEGVVGYVQALKAFALEGRIVGEWDISGYRAPGPFGLGEFVGLVYFRAPSIPDVTLPADALAGVLLTEGELAMASRCSERRVLNALGRVSRYFPTPYWTDPLRPPVYAVADVERSLLVQFPRARVSAASATLRGDHMYLVLPRDFAQALAERIAKGEPAAVLTGRAADTQAALVWAPGQTEPEAIIEDGASPAAIAATFVAFAPAGVAHDEVRFMEDGYAALLSTDSSRSLAQALRAGTSHVLQDTTGRMLHVRCDA